MHEKWLDLIPYYVNRTLPDAERAAFEHHLTTCDTCRRALEEWHTVAGVVHAEVDRWAREAPALSARVRANLGLPASSNGHSRYQTAFDPNQTVSVYTSQRSRRVGGRIPLPLTLVAAAAVALTFGALLLYIASRGDESPARLSADVEVVTLTPTRTPSPAVTLGAITATPGFLLSSPVPTSEDLGILPLPKTPTRYVPPTPTLATTPFPYASPLIPTPTIYWPPTPTAAYGDGIGIGYVLVTTEQVGPIPAGVRVRISHAWYDGSSWIYAIMAEDEVSYAEAHTWQLAYAPDFTPGPPPTAAYQGAIGMGYLMVTTEQVGAIPPGARVRISHASYDGYGWLYYIASLNGQDLVEAHEWQLAYAPDVTPGPTPTAYFGAQIGSGTWLRTTESVGAIPSGARVRIGSAWFDGIEWYYGIVAEDGITSAEARTSQLTYDTQPVPSYTPTYTFTPTPTPLTTVTIKAFSAAPEEAEFGATITLSWQVFGPARVGVREVYASGEYGQWYTDLPPEGTLDVSVPTTGDSITYQLVAEDATGTLQTAQIQIALH
jgi:hypothetical protein